MRKRSLAALATVSAAAFLLAACSSSSSGGAGGTASGGSTHKVGVILPDSASSPRWEANDRPLLKAAFDAAGIQSDIQNAGGEWTDEQVVVDGSLVTSRKPDDLPLFNQEMTSVFSHARPPRVA